MASLHPELHSFHPHHAPRFAFSGPVEAQLEPDAPTHILLRRASLEPGEFERTELSTVEVMGFWGSTILFARHLPAAKDFLIGEGSQLTPVDFEIPTAGLGGPVFKLVEARAGVAHLLVPEGARAQLRQPGDAGLAPTAATSVALLPGTIVELELGRLKFRVASVAAGQATPRAGLKSAEGSVLSAFGVSFGVAAALIASFAFWMPALDATDDEELTTNSRTSEFLIKGDESPPNIVPIEKHQAYVSESSAMKTPRRLNEIGLCTTASA